MSRHSKHKNRTGLKFLALFVAFTIVSAAIIFYEYLYIKRFNRAYDPSDRKNITITIPSGSGTERIGRILQDNGLIKDYKTFKYKSKICGYDGTYQAGTFALNPAMTMTQIMDTLQKAYADTVRFTIPEGYSIRNTSMKLEAEGICSAEDFYKALEEGGFGLWFEDLLPEGTEDPTGSVSAAANRYEGFLFPDTYEVYEDAKARDVAEKMLRRFAEVFDADMQAKAEQMGGVTRVITIASLIEREAAVDSERAKVAGVIMNRLKTGMNLQFCSSVQYILGDPKANLTTADTQISSPYNTYINPGLTPGPIASPGMASIKAALEPEEHDYLYFVLKSVSSSEHNFAVTYDEFLKYKTQYNNSK